MTHDRPTVAVVMCTYNGGRFIREQLDSILAQTYPISQIIVQDDCSTDDTVAIVRHYAQTHTAIRLHVNERNIGFNANFRRALSRATCRYIAISDQDDVWYAHKIERQVQSIGDKDLCGTAYDKGASMDDAKFMPADTRLERFVFGGGVAGHTMLLSREFLMERNRWIDGITYDWSLLLNACFAGGVVILQEPLNWHRRHEGALGTVFQQRGATTRTAITPYARGWQQYRALQKKQNWQAVYSFIHDNTGPDTHPLAHRLSDLMLRTDGLSLMKLCFTCLKHKRLVYPDQHRAASLMGSVRALAYPAIFAYGNYYFDWAE